MSHKALQTDSSQMETINQGENSMKSELLTKRDAAITTLMRRTCALALTSCMRCVAESMAMRKKTGFKQKAK